MDATELQKNSYELQDLRSENNQPYLSQIICNPKTRSKSSQYFLLTRLGSTGKTEETEEVNEHEQQQKCY